jgi:flavin reductase (DIM6/NTAB) family NADH-FMN oxidoreductase RutF
MLHSSAQQPADADEIDGPVLRRTMSHVAMSVALLTVRSGDVTLGVTIESLISVSLEPPLVLFSLHAGSSLLPKLRTNRFGLTVLASHQGGIAAMWGTAPRPPVPATLLECGGAGDGLRIRDGAAWLLTGVETMHSAGDHVLVVGRVLQAQPGTRPPLLHYDRSYRGVGPLDAPI